MDFKDMTMGHKILLIGGGVLVIFFLVKAVQHHASTTQSTLSTSVDPNQIQSDIGNYIQGAVQQVSQTDAANLAQYQQQEQANITQLMTTIQQGQQQEQNLIQQQQQAFQQQMQQQQQSLQQQFQSITGLISQMPSQQKVSSDPVGSTAWAGTGNNGQGNQQVGLAILHSNDPSVIQSEIQRTEAVMSNRQALGESTGAQSAWLSQLQQRDSQLLQH